MSVSQKAIQAWIPYAFAVACGAYGIVNGQMAWVAMAAGFVGLPSFTKGVSVVED
jgi:hypothetical protein